MAKNTYGTGCFLLLTGAGAVASRNNLLTTTAVAAGRAKPQYALEGSGFHRRCRRNGCATACAPSKTAADVEALAAEVPDSGGVYLVPAFAGLGAPHWDQ